MRENLHNKGHIRTYTGEYVNLLNPDPETIRINDIAHALSNMPRWGGHSPVFFSVAQHSVMCAERAESKYALDLLMHDASEAYLMDVPHPLKSLIPAYKELEDRFMGVIARKYGLKHLKDPHIKIIDEYMLNMEWYEIVLNPECGLIKPWSPLEAESEFIRVFNHLILK